MNRTQKALLFLPAAFGLLVVVSVGIAATFAGAEAEVPELHPVVHGDEAPAFALASGKGTVRLLLDAQTGAKEAAMSELLVAPGGVMPVHKHARSAELLYVLEGWAIMLVDGKQVEVRAGDAVYLPPGVEHSAKVQGKHLPFRAIQIYAPPGPEQRFRRGPRVPLE